MFKQEPTRNADRAQKFANLVVTCQQNKGLYDAQVQRSVILDGAGIVAEPKVARNKIM